MFEGEHTVSMDDKGRVSIPAGFREALRRHYDDERIVITREYDGCLRVYPPKEWDKNLQKFRTQNTNDRKARSYARFVIGSATTCSPDKQGRVLVSPTLRQGANLNKQIVFAGGPDYFEIWDADRHGAMLAEAQQLLLDGGPDF
ncbi:MAG: division/cell wall cluster transcriptional repressor MraZ [Mariprofundaceae bacterium]|nr:division/cell wall cluster transcriptional repressor MraZ [Mariprofundaceae bacterium]